MVEISFESRNVVVNESDGSVTICLEKNVDMIREDIFVDVTASQFLTAEARGRVKTKANPFIFILCFFLLYRNP